MITGTQWEFNTLTSSTRYARLRHAVQQDRDGGADAGDEDGSHREDVPGLGVPAFHAGCGRVFG